MEGCSRKRIVGLGRDPVWLCEFHFGERLKGVRKVANAARRALKKETPATT
jgi:hypothetical protein